MTAAVRTEQRTGVVRTVGDTDVPATIATHAATQAIIAPLLPAGVTFDQVAAQVRLALAKDVRGDLKKCTVGSVILAVAKICGWGLEVGVTAHLVPFGDQCTALRDYTGDIQLAIESGMVRHVEAYVLYANELFKIIRGTESSIQHHPIQDQKGRGAMVGVYAMIYLRGAHGYPVVEHMTTEEVDAIRQQYSKQWKQGPVPRWYMKKTVIRQGLKLIPKTPKLLALLAKFDADERIDTGALDAALAADDTLALSSGGRVADVPAQAGPKALAAVGYGDPVLARPLTDAEELALDDRSRERGDGLDALRAG
jgi:recombination protein RecT